MKNKILIYSSIVLLILTIAGIFLYSQYKKALSYCWKINILKTKIYSIGIKSVKMNLALDFKNSSDIDLSILGYTFDVLLNGVKVGYVNNSEKQLIKADDFSVFNIGIEFNPEQAFNDKNKSLNIAKDFLVNKKNIVFYIKGFVSAGLLGLKMEKVPVDVNFTLEQLLTPSIEPEQKCK